MAATISSILSAIAQAGSSAAGAAGSALSSAGSAIGSAGSAVGSALGDAGSAIGSTLGDVAKAGVNAGAHMGDPLNISGGIAKILNIGQQGAGAAAEATPPLMSAGTGPVTSFAAPATAYGAGPYATVAPMGAEGGLSRLLSGFGEFGRSAINPETYFNVGGDIAQGRVPSVPNFAAFYLQKQLADEIQRKAGPTAQPLLNYIGNTFGSFGR